MSFVIFTPVSASSKAISAIILLTPAALLELFAMEQSAPRLSDRSSNEVVSSTWCDHSLRATKTASASHRVVKADSPLALKLQRSDV